MIYGFDTEDEAVAAAALIVYAVWRSRDRERFKITLDVWGRVEGHVKAAAKTVSDLPLFLQRLKGRLCCTTLAPVAMRTGDVSGDAPLEFYLDPDTGALQYAIQREQIAPREFMTGILGRPDQRSVLVALKTRPAWVVLLVQNRIERERPIQAALGSLDRIPVSQETSDVA